MSKFQIILLCFFGFFMILAVLIFAIYKGGGSTQADITIWGDLPAEDFSMMLNSTASVRGSNINMNYVEKSTDTLDEEFTEALAQGGGPDLLITTQDKFLQQKSKLIAIPYQSVSERDFKQTFIEEGELFLTGEGIYALPLLVDPLVLYHNRDHNSSAGNAKPIAYWDEIYSAATKLTKRDAAGNITQSTIALGETRNIPHAKDILSLLFLQAGTPITGFIGTELRSVLSYNFDLPVMPGEAALDFYTQFSNPAKPYYSWNRTLPLAQNHFTSGDSAYYIGYASELKTLRGKNPTLNFGVSAVPQSRVSGRKTTYGKLYAVAMSRGTANIAGAFEAARLLASRAIAGPLAQIMILPPARRDLLSQKQSDSILPVFYDSALQARGWLDPEYDATRIIFNKMIDDVIPGRSRHIEAVNAADRELGA